MSNDYQISAIALIAALLLAFAYLHLRFRSVRTALWILALVCAEIQSILVFVVSRATFGKAFSIPKLAATFPVLSWINVAAECSLMLSSVLFLASLTSPSFRVGRVRILYAVPYLIPLFLYSFLYYGVSQHPTGKLMWIYWALTFLAAVIALIWSRQKGPVPSSLGSGIILFGALACIPFFLQGDVYWPMRIVESGNMLMTGILVIYTYRRLSPGVLLATIGFAAWAIPPFFLLHPASIHSGIPELFLDRVVVLGKVFVALSLILVVLEDELRKNRQAQKRERRVRLELEAYARQAMTARSLEEFDRDSNQLCQMIVEQSHFSGAAIIVRGIAGYYTLVGYAGIDGATAGALDAVAQRLPANCFSSSADSPAPPLVPDSVSLNLDLTPWLTPGDDLERLRLTRVGAVPMLGPDTSTEGALLLISPRVPLETLRADDLLPLEIFAGRLQAARAQALMLGKLIESERFAGVGQLATNVAEQLNNPLTVILGYAALLEESVAVGAERRGAEAIVVEARRMKSILERLSRFSRLTTQQFSAFSIADLLTDIEQFHRTEFLRHSIEFHLIIEPDLPQIFGNTHQVRQALLHSTQFAIDGVVRLAPGQEKAITIHAISEPGFVRITIAHTGNGFPYPERAFDSLSAGFSGTEATGIGLSLCAAIVREHRGHISATNHQPQGAAVILELPIN